jgi:Acetyltransferase (GNAT) domain
MQHEAIVRHAALAREHASAGHEIGCRIISAKSQQVWADAIGPYSAETSFGAAYHLMSERIWGGEAFLAVLERGGDRLIWPYILHPIPGAQGCWDINSAYGFVGPLVIPANSGEDTGFVNDAVDHVMWVWREIGVVSVFTRFCPFHENHKPLQSWVQANREISGSIETSGHAVAINLLQTPEERWLDFQPSLRQRIRKEEKLGLRGEPDPDWARFDDFLAIYDSVGGRNEFSERHRLNREDFLTMRQSLGGNAVLLHVMDGDRVAASRMCVVSGKVVHSLFAGPHPDYLRRGAYKLLNKITADWAAEHGFHYLNIGGGRGGSDMDSLFAFKRAFSKLQLPFYVGRFILNSSVYDMLTCEAQRRYRDRGLQQSPHFFPAYRDPGVTAATERNEEIREVLAGVEA